MLLHGEIKHHFWDGAAFVITKEKLVIVLYSTFGQAIKFTKPIVI